MPDELGPDTVRLNALRISRAYSREHLERGLAGGEFLLHYQPIVAINKHGVRRRAGAEALMRWQVDTQLRSPAEFLPAIAGAGLDIAFDRWVLGEAVAQTKIWKRTGVISSKQPISINVSDTRFRDEALPEDVADVLAKAAVQPNMIRLEISEHATLAGKRAKRQVSRLKDIKTMVLLDDAGTGNAHIYTFADLGVDGIKIDRKYVLASNTYAGSIMLGALVELARRLGLIVVAEGVETPEQAKFLLEHGCTTMQGYLFGKPMLAQEFAASMVD
jgi:EAL domain-containing protein (putative c-di-GMP-specific phosphodiesterase class I)